MTGSRLTNMHETSPLVSIIVPIFNAERYLRGCLDSIVNQSYQQLEILLVDDGSTDESPSICDEYAARDDRVTAIHQRNGGIAVAQNAGLDAANGDYIAFCDNDDIMHHANIQTLLDALLSTHADMAKGRWSQIGISDLSQISKRAHESIAGARRTVIDDPLRAYQRVFCKTLRILGGAKTEARYFNEANWCRLYKKQLWQHLRFVPEHYAQDIRMAGPLYSQMTRVVDVDRVLYYWLQEPDSVTHSKRGAEFWHDNVSAAAENFSFTLAKGIIPYRNYFGLTASLRDERLGIKDLRRRGQSSDGDFDRLLEDKHRVHSLITRLSMRNRCVCWLMAKLRSCENVVYDQTIHSLR